MTILKFSFVTFVLVGVLLSSCSKNDGLTPEVTSKDEVLNQLTPQSAKTDENIIFLIDDEVTDKRNFQFRTKGMTYHISIGEKDNPESENIYYMAFSNPNDYDNYMRSEIGRKYDVQQAIIAHLRDYAQTSGAVDYLERNGAVPQFYLDYEQRYLEENLPTDFANANNQRTVMGVLFKNLFCNDAFNVTLPLAGTPFFIFNNNEASAFEGLFIGGYHTCFDRSFYRRPIFGLTVWGFNCLNLPPSVEDRASSWWTVGI